MKYVQPLGISDPNASYIDGNPSTGTKGSAVPAASIEDPQREVVNFITDSGALVPADTDLHQLGKSIQSNKVNYGVDIGTVNAVLVVLSPVPDAYYAGMQVRFKAKLAPTGAATLDAGRGVKPILKSGGGTLAGGEWSVGDIVQVSYDLAGNHWQLPVSPYATLYAARDYYVNGTTGSDSNDGLSAGTAFATLQKAQNTVNLFNLNGYTATIHAADGNYAAVNCPIINGTGNVVYIGNTTTPANCIVSSTTGPCFFVTGGPYTFRGFKVTTSGHVGGSVGAGFWVIGAGSANLYEIDFGYCIDHNVTADQGGVCIMAGPITVSAGGGVAHIAAVDASFVSSPYPNPTPINILPGVSFSGAWMIVSTNAIAAIRYSPYTGASNVTGTSKYSVTTNGVINSLGSGVNYYPGTIAGTAATGGQYV